VSGKARRRPAPGTAEARARDPAVRALVVRLYRDQRVPLKRVARLAGFSDRHGTRRLVRAILDAEGVEIRGHGGAGGNPTQAEPRRPRVLAAWPAGARFADEVRDREAGAFFRGGPAATAVETASPLAGLGE
jgi:hypothetical protein